MREKDERKATLILEKAKELFFYYGIRRVTVEDIADAASLGKGTIYIYFKNKQDIVLRIALEYLKTGLDETEKLLAQISDPQDQMRLMLKYYPVKMYEFVSQYKHGEDFLKYLDYHQIQRLGFGHIVEKYHGFFHSILELGIQQGTFRVDNMDNMVENICFMSGAFLPPYKEREMTKERLNELIEQYGEMLLTFLTGS